MSLDATSGPKGLEVATTKLTGIVRGAGTTLALVETQDGIGYILKPGDTLGDGRLVRNRRRQCHLRRRRQARVPQL